MRCSSTRAPSSANSSPRSSVRGDRNRECEQLAAGSGLDWVSLRPSVFASNFAGMWSGQIRAGDVVSGPYARTATAVFAEADIGLLEAGVGAPAPVTDDVPRILGRPATPFAQWVAENRSLFAEHQGAQHV